MRPRAAGVFVHSEAGRTLNATLFNRIIDGWGPVGPVFVTVALLSEAVFLFAAAQTGFLSAPRVLSYMSMDRWFPQQFSLLSERFVIKNGLALTGIAALATLLLTGGSVRFMVVLYSINVFITFTLSQLGMVRHWISSRHQTPAWRKKIAVNGVGLVLTVFILVSMVVLKFRDGGWITIFVTGALMLVAVTIRRFYAPHAETADAPRRPRRCRGDHARGKSPGRRGDSGGDRGTTRRPGRPSSS